MKIGFAEMETQQTAETIDWSAVKSKLQQTFDALDVHLSEADALALMDERARKAAEIAGEDNDGDKFEIFTFSLTSLSGKQYGIEAEFVQEIFRFGDYAPIPGVEEFVVGITTLREEVLAVVDLRKFWGLPSTGMHDNAWVIALGRDEPEFGVLVDEIHEVKQIRFDDLNAVNADNSAASPATEMLWGTNGDLSVLRAEQLLDDPRLVIYQEDLPLV